MTNSLKEFGFQAPDYLERYEDVLDHENIRKLRADRLDRVWAERTKSRREAVLDVMDLRSESFEFGSSKVRIGNREELNDEQQERWYRALRAFCPWKKGPFELFGTSIDSEWRSELKWSRILPHIKDLKNHKVVDIGCHNGYFMFRMLEQSPEMVIGLEPVGQHLLSFQLLQNVVRSEALHFELLGVEHMNFYPKFFDTIFCLGILYHYSDPIGLLRSMRASMAKGGQIIIDCQGVAGDQPISFTPRGRYANARGIWFLPTESCLLYWMIRAGFSNPRCIFAEPLSSEEQRRTDWADIDSLENFLDPEDSTKTMEGYPAPWRYYFVAER